MIKLQRLCPATFVHFVKGANFCNISVAVNKKSSGHWEDPNNVKKFLLEFKEKLNLNTPEDWSIITSRQLRKNGGRSLLSYLTLYDIKCLGCPEGKFIFSKKASKQTISKDDKEEIQNFVQLLQKNLNFKTNDDWKLLTKKQVIEFGGKHLLEKYTLKKLINYAVPDVNIISKKPSGYWEDLENVKNFLLHLKDVLHLNTPKDWNSITKNHISLYGGSSLLKKYSIFELKCIGYPDGEIFYDKPSGYWDNMENIQSYISQLGKSLNFNSEEDWNTLTHQAVRNYGGASLMKKYSILEIKQMGFPTGKFNTIKPSGYWDNENNILDFYNTLRQKFNLQNPSDWNGITKKQIVECGGRTLLYKFSMYDIKCMACPEGKDFFSLPYKISGFWEKYDNIQGFIEHLKENLDLTTIDDWNSLTHKQIIDSGGSRLLSKYSIFEIKCMGCPEGIDYFDKPKKPPGYWENRENITNFIDSFKIKYDLKSKDDWNRISKQQIYEQGGRGLLKASQNPEFISKTENIPEISELTSTKQNNQSNSTAKLKRSSQRWLFLQIQKIFTGEEIVEDYFHPEISRKSGFNVQFDVYLTNKKIAFEYHGKQHYEDIPSTFSPLEIYQHRDSEKQQLCGEFGIQLIVIPYWWDNSIESLKETIDYNLSNKVNTKN